MARMVTGEVFLTRSRLEERPPDPELEDGETKAVNLLPPVSDSISNWNLFFQYVILYDVSVYVSRSVGNPYDVSHYDDVCTGFTGVLA